MMGSPRHPCSRVTITDMKGALPPRRVVLLYLTTIPVFFLVDLAWLGLVAPGFYSRHIGHLMNDRVALLPAALFYLLFIAGIVGLAVAPAVENRSWTRAARSGSLLGLVAYGTYDLTNLATLKDWPVIVTVVDVVWGTVLAATVSVASYFIGLRLVRR